MIDYAERRRKEGCISACTCTENVNKYWRESRKEERKEKELKITQIENGGEHDQAGCVQK